ncbi:DNA-directed RNA polymerase subunit beta' [Patescibacteria group bacterium]|nr:DNA-directed RNA polymerase subunit beta' [Patescibacteria group bacterium]MBU1673327.1 DNA-directed RNA polymerase subunit beta' [Patescibacteria group bacterium]MBU1963554.1 DNA-directed RNA polymerase subunit beta' [Patescibacteria group bacterium]
MAQESTQTIDFNAMQLKIASPEDIHEWSHGEITRPETINYRTQKPEKDGLFCEKIFGPSKDWECYCGKYKKIRYKGIVCDKCGVEVTRSIVRRERMGHIDLAAPVSHIWFLRGVPSKIGLVLNLPPQALEKVIYFASFIVTKVDDDLKEETLGQIDQEAESKRKMIKSESTNYIGAIKQKKEAALQKAKDEAAKKKVDDEFEQELINAAIMRDEKVKDLEEAVDLAKSELKELKAMQIISENKYQDLSLKYGHVFEASIGAEAVYELLKETNVIKLIEQIEEDLVGASKNVAYSLIRRLKLLRNLRNNSIDPDWMILNAIPVIPPDLRPMVQLDGGRFAASDLNDLYRRVINRNNRLKRLQELNAPEVIQRNEKRMLQEAVDALIDNSARHGKTVTASTGQKRMLKSLADMLKGKQGRFRQNLLGKRVDYSGRSVIVVGPHLKLDQCGLPKKMALELFRPFVISKLIEREYVYNVRSANRFIESDRPEVWDILEEVTLKAFVLLNRAPTLHRLGIQAFRPILIEGKAIQIHPLVCTAFNADFDGDQMAVHVPLTADAVHEAEHIMLSSKNLLKPATGEPVVTPSQDIVLGAYFMTAYINEESKEKLFHFYDVNEVKMALGTGRIEIGTKVKVRLKGKLVETSAGRILFNEVLPENQQFCNKLIDKKELKDIIAECFARQGLDRTAKLLDDVKDLAIEMITVSGMSWGMGDTPVPPQKEKLMADSEKQVAEIQGQFDMGLLTDEERRQKVIEIWTTTKNDITKLCQASLGTKGSAYAMIDSGARGSWGQVTQMTGMKGLVINPSGETIELPVKASFVEGFNVLEYFMSTHGARKGLSDTALRTANAGYLTRRLIDVAQDIVVIESDCGTKEGLVITREESEEIGEPLEQRVVGRVLAQEIKNPNTKKVVFKRNYLVTQDDVEALEKLKLDSVKIRSVFNCETIRGICKNCYGYDLGHNKMVEEGTAVGIIAAQSIGEPGTQLTMRTFHTGGVAGHDITQGLPRVEELFEARPLKKSAVLADVEGQVEEVAEVGNQKVVKVRHLETVTETHKLTKKLKVIVKDKQKVKETDPLIIDENGEEIKAGVSGTVVLEKKELSLTGEKQEIKEFPIPVGFGCWAKPGDLVTKGLQLSEGNLDLRNLYELQGMEAVQKYIIKEIQYIYSSQGQKLNDKHVEIIIRQMFSRYLITEPGGTDFVQQELITRDQLLEANIDAKAEKKDPVVADHVLLGITKASLSTDSFLSAASFQETARVLIDAAISGKIDKLRGLKENVIIGKLIPVGTGFAAHQKEMADIALAKTRKK